MNAQVHKVPGRLPVVSLFLHLAVAFAVSVTVPALSAQTLTTIYSFHDAINDGWWPSTTPILDAAGNLYGTADGGDSACKGNTCGLVYRVDSLGTETVLHTFSLENGDGNDPESFLLRYKGKLYGETYFGGNSACSEGCGVLYEINDSGSEKILLAPATTLGDGGLIHDSAGNFYGTILGNGNCAAQKCGTVFELVNGKEQVLYNFQGPPDGSYPGPLLMDGGGNLFGVNANGGVYNMGAIFELSPNPDHTWTEKILYSFRGNSDGRFPYMPLILDEKGNLYGATQEGGLMAKPAAKDCRFPGCGVLFKLHQNADGSWSEAVLHTFTGGEDGAYPAEVISRDKAGNIYGTTVYGGTYDEGTAFVVTPDRQETLLHVFTGGVDGGYPIGLRMGPDGTLYGATGWGGDLSCRSSFGCGTVYKIVF